MILVNNLLYSCNAVTQYVDNTLRYSEKRGKRGLMQWQQWLIILAVCHHMIRVIKLHQRKKCVHCIIKIIILKFPLTIYSKQWKKEVSSYSTTNYVMDFWKQWQRNIMQRLVQVEDRARYVMENMWQSSMAISAGIYPSSFTNVCFWKKIEYLNATFCEKQIILQWSGALKAL